tara:strand:- start:1275 stop:1568 length:294 start_codon:yes stop_codon:yes gene_type:complete
MSKTDEWGWFIPEDVPYIHGLSKKVQYKIKKGEFKKNSIIIKKGMPVIPEEVDNKHLIKKLDEKYDFGNVFATTIVNSLLFCTAGIWFYFSRDKDKF